MTVSTPDGGETDRVCDAVLLACGPWTSSVARELKVKMKTTVLGQKAYSVLLEPKGEVDDSCLFMDWRGDQLVGEFELVGSLYFYFARY